MSIIEAGTSVLTVNNRLARALSAVHARALYKAGQRAWETPDVLPFSAFVIREWEYAQERNGGGLPRLLSAKQSSLLWQHVVRESNESRSGALLSSAGAAASAAKARELLMRFEVRLGVSQCESHIDAQAFWRWHKEYEARLAAEHWIDVAGASSALASQIEAGHARLPRCIRMAGFDQISAQQQSLLDAFGDAGVGIEFEPAPEVDVNPHYLTFDSPQQELQAMARWARALLDEGHAGPIGIVLPDLDERLEWVDMCFEDYLHPSPEVQMRPAFAHRAFNISLGRSLDQLPVVLSALAALQLQLPAIDMPSVGTVLRSQYLHSAPQEHAARLALDLKLRDAGVRRIRPKRLASLAKSARVGQLSQQLAQVQELTPRARSVHSLAEHAQRFTELLGLLGWPNGKVTTQAEDEPDVGQGRALSSIEFQAVEAFRAQLEVLATMATVTGPCGSANALSLLQGLLSDALFQARSDPAPVQIMGVLEAAGMSFSKLWIGALDDNQWPPVETPNPLLPIAFQRQQQMPGASPELSLQRAQNIMQRLLGAASQVLVSHANADGETPLRASPMLAQFDRMDASDLSLSQQPLPDAAIAEHAPVLEQLVDWHVRAVGRERSARGGTRVLTDQAACPFRAFARNRLAAVNVQQGDAPLDARSRGNMAHQLMQELFTQITDSEVLHSLGDEQRRQLCDQVAEHAVKVIVARHPGEVPASLVKLEVQRLSALALNWLLLESQRAPFQVEALEQTRIVTIGGLKLKVQLDRVDRVAEKRLLIDYKTGKTRRGAWFGIRPDEPQLPLYALALDSDGRSSAPVAAVSFARLRRADEGYDGVGEDPLWLPGLKELGKGLKDQEKAFEDMAQLKDHWREVLSDLADEFAQGDARVDPKPTACRYCEMRALCRIDAMRPESLDEEQ